MKSKLLISDLLGIRIALSGILLSLVSLPALNSQSEIFIPYRGSGYNWGLADTLGNVVLQPSYDKVVRIKGACIQVKNRGENGIVNIQNEIIVPFREKNQFYYSKDYLFCSSDTSAFQGYYSYESGEKIFPENIKTVTRMDIFPGKFYKTLTETGKLGVVKLSDNNSTIEEWLIDTAYIEIRDTVSLNYVVVETDKGEYLYSPLHTPDQFDSLDQVRYPVPDFYGILDEIEDQGEGLLKWSTYTLAKVVESDGYALVIEKEWTDQNGITQNTRDTLNKRYENLTIISQERWFYSIDSTNWNKQQSVALVVDKEGRQGVLDSYGNIIIPFEYDSISVNSRPICRYSYFLAQKNAKWGVVNSKNEIVLPFDYEHIDYSSAYGSLGFKKNGRYGLYIPARVGMNGDGEIVRSPVEMFEPKSEYPLVGITYFSGYAVAIIQEGKYSQQIYFDRKGFIYQIASQKP
jgi:hypothetical protein